MVRLSNLKQLVHTYQALIVCATTLPVFITLYQHLNTYLHFWSLGTCTSASRTHVVTAEVDCKAFYCIAKW